MYNTKVVCTYNTPEVFLETDKVRDEEKNFIRDAIYRQELLNILEIEEYDETQIDKAFYELYEKLRPSAELMECIDKILCKYNVTNVNKDLIGLMLLYAFDYMFLTHICVSEFIETGKINKPNMLMLKSVIS
jgi:hypothetical protein